jgi:hypothetical protein
VRPLHGLNGLGDDLRIPKVDSSVAVEIVHPPIAVVVDHDVGGVTGRSRA